LRMRLEKTTRIRFVETRVMTIWFSRRHADDCVRRSKNDVVKVSIDRQVAGAEDPIICRGPMSIETTKNGEREDEKHTDSKNSD
jgi:hypothetical protein